MAFCKQCGNEVAATEAFCRKCGARLSAVQGGSGPAFAATAGNDEDLEVFIGKNADTYLNKFGKFQQGGADSFAVTWHWPAFLFGVTWMIYRKMYLWALAMFAVSFVPCGGFLAAIAAGMTGNYLYYKHAQKKILELNSRVPSSGPQRTAELARAGGVLSIIWILIPLGVIALVGIIAAIAIPQFAAYRIKAYDVKAKLQVQDACSRGQAIFAEHPEKTLVEPDDLLYAGLVRTEDVEMMLLDGRRGTFSVSGRHVKGSKLFITDRECRLTEERQAQ
jgi:Tfp pilus assembly major pilin PilA